MPRFRDENDFPDVETEIVDRPSFSSEAVSSFKISRRLVDDPETGSLRVVEPRGDFGYRADTVPSPKDLVEDDDEADQTFVDIARPDDARRSPVRSSNRWPSTLYGTPVRTSLNNSWLPVFTNPDVVIPCIERHTRREVLFAKRRAGRGGRRRPPRRNYWSKVHC